MGNSPSMEYWNWPWAPSDEFLIEAVENVGRCQRSDHIRKAVNYVKILLEKQADPNARDEWGHGYALHYAIWCGQMDVVKLLLDADGCNVEADTGQYFRGYDQYIRPIHMAAYEARPDLMRLLLAGGASVEAPDRKGRTPVQCVLAPTFFDGESLVGKPTKTTARQRLTLQLLIEKGADVNRPFTPESLPAVPFKRLVNQCPTALHLACDRGDIGLVKVLLGGYRVDINGENCPLAATPLQIAVEQKDLDLVKILKHAGANAELARLTVATKLQHLKRNSAGGASTSSDAEPSTSNGHLRTPEQVVPSRIQHSSPPSPSGHPSPVQNKGKSHSTPSSPFQLPLPQHSREPSPEITPAPEEDVKGKRSLWPPPTPVTRAGVPPLGDKRNPRHERRNSNTNLYPGRLERRDSETELKLDGRDPDVKMKSHQRRDSSEDLRRANSNFARLHSSRSTDLLLAQV